MANIGEKLKTVFRKLGTAYTILRDGVAISGEYLDQEEQTSNSEFQVEFVRKGSLFYDTEVVAGDVIRYDLSGEAEENKEHFLVVSLDTDTFKNKIITKKALLYKASQDILHYRLSGEINEATEEQVMHWNLEATTRGLVLNESSSLVNEGEAPYAVAPRMSLKAYVSKALNVLTLDRIALSGETVLFEESVTEPVNFLVEAVQRHLFRGVDVVVLREDTRE